MVAGNRVFPCLGVVDPVAPGSIPEGKLSRVGVEDGRVGCQLKAPLDSPAQVQQEVGGGNSVTGADHLSHEQAAVGVEGRAGPRIPASPSMLRLRHAVGLLTDKAPDFVDLDGGTGEVAYPAVVLPAGRPSPRRPPT